MDIPSLVRVYSTYPAYLISFDVVETNNDNTVLDSTAFWVMPVDSTVSPALPYSGNVPAMISASGQDWSPLFNGISATISAAVAAQPDTVWGTLPDGTYITAEMQNFQVTEYSAPTTTTSTYALD